MLDNLCTPFITLSTSLDSKYASVFELMLKACLSWSIDVFFLPSVIKLEQIVVCF